MFGFYEKYFKIFGLEITYYGLLIAIGMAAGVFVAYKNAKHRGLKGDDLILVACYVLPLSIIGARLYYVLFSLDEFTNFWQIFEIWNGGMAIYGGVIGGAIGILIYCLIHKKNFLDVADIAVPSLILGQVIGRWGNFLNQEAYGMYIENPSAQWFPIGVYIDNCHQHGCLCNGYGWHMATFFYESMWNLMAFIVLMVLLKKNKLKYRGSLMSVYLIIYGVGRAWIEGLRMDSLYIGSIRVSQLLAILLIIFGIGFILTSYLLHRKGKIKSLKELEPYYASQLAKNDKKSSIKIEIQKDSEEDHKTKENKEDKTQEVDNKNEKENE